MAYGTKYNAYWDDKSLKRHEIKLLLDGYASTVTEITKTGAIPCTISIKGDKDLQTETVLLGSELVFNFFVADADLATFDAIFESEWKEWKIEHYYDSILDWVGMLQPENFSRQWIKEGGYYQFSLSATDGIGILKNIEFVNASTLSQYTDRVSIISTIKRALEHTGLDIDFRVQLGTYETTLMTSTECALSEMNIDNSRFTKDKEGREVNEDCYSIIEKSLKPFSCILVQSGAKWWIVNPQEKNSYYFPITWSTLAVGTRTAHDLRLAIPTINFTEKGEIQKIRPLESVGITFRDRNVQDSVLSNGNFASASTAEWNASADVYSFTTQSYLSDYELSVGIIPPALMPSATPYFYSDGQAITFVEVGDTIDFRFKIRCTDITMDGGWSGDPSLEKVKVTARIRKTTIGGAIIGSLTPIIIGEADSSYVTYSGSFLITSSDTYYLEFFIEEMAGGWANYQAAEIRFDDFYMSAIYASVDVTFDRYFKYINLDSVFNDRIDLEISFGDSVQDNDIGSIQQGGVRSEFWNRYGKTDNTYLYNIFASNILNNFARYKNYIRVSMLDATHTIKPYSLLTIDSRDYQIVNLDEIYNGNARKEVDLELIEVLNTDVSAASIWQNLNTIDGN